MEPRHAGSGAFAGLSSHWNGGGDSRYGRQDIAKEAQVQYSSSELGEKHDWSSVHSVTMIDILLATYNGTKYLPELLRSLDRQTFRDWRLIVRDDASSDGSLETVEAWVDDHAERALVIRDDGVRL